MEFEEISSVFVMCGEGFFLLGRMENGTSSLFLPESNQFLQGNPRASKHDFLINFQRHIIIIQVCKIFQRSKSINFLEVF